MNTKELSVSDPEAFESLPDPFKYNSPMEFFVDDKGYTCATSPNGKQYVFIVGRWVSKINIEGA